MRRFAAAVRYACSFVALAFSHLTGETFPRRYHRGSDPIAWWSRVPLVKHTFDLLAIPLVVCFALTSECFAKNQSNDHVIEVLVTIQDAVNKANPGDTIYIPSGVYRENVIIEKSLHLMGAGFNNTIVDGDTDGDGNGNGRVFYIAPKVTVTLSKLKIQNGNAYNDSSHPNPAEGGGILNLGSLTLKDCHFYNNTADHGGGIGNWAGEIGAEANLVVYNCIVDHSRLALGGGGIQNTAEEGRATTNVWHTAIRDNITRDPGGGINNKARNGRATFNVWYSTIFDNHADGAHGGGLYNYVYDGTGIAILNVYSSCVKENTAETDGGGIGVDPGRGTSIVNIHDSDVSFNEIKPAGSGGGINNQATGEGSSAILNIYDSRIHHNTATGGGGISNWAAGDGTATANVWRSTIHHNLGGGISNFADNGTVIGNVQNVKIHHNSAEQGAGLYNEESDGGTAIMIVTSSEMIGNLAKSDGGGVWNGGLLTLENCSILNNKADHNKEDEVTGHGGGIFYVTSKEPILLGVNRIRHNTPEDIYEEIGP